MMARLTSILLLIIVPLQPLTAAEWSRYVNPRFGAAVDIPPGFHADGNASEGEGRRFRAENGRATISLWGAPSAASGFSQAVRERIAADEAEGWSITYRSETPDWAAWGGTRAGHVFYAKTIATCEGRQMAAVRLQYPAADIPNFDPIASRLGQTLGQDGGCF